jgi:hypothetical protein
LQRLHTQTAEDPDNEGLVDRNTRLACDLHAHKLLLYRNNNTTTRTVREVDASALLSSFVFLTGRHTFGKPCRAFGSLLVPENEMYELLSHVRRHVVAWARTQTQGPVDRVMQTALQVSTSSTGSLRASAEIVEVQNRWSKIKGSTSSGRYAVTSTRTIAMNDDDLDDSTQHLKTGSLDSLDSLGSLRGTSGTVTNKKTNKKTLLRQPSEESVVSFARDTRQWGVEMDLQLGQMTLRSRHLSALPANVANNKDVLYLFGESTIQASTLESGEHRRKFRLVGLSHELHYWHTPHTSCAPMSDVFEREYNPVSGCCIVLARLTCTACIACIACTCMYCIFVF